MLDPTPNPTNVALLLLVTVAIPLLVTNSIQLLVVAGPLATTECDSDQLCAGLKASVNSAVHAVSEVWVEADQDELNGFLVIDAENAFNSCSRVNMLWNI